MLYKLEIGAANVSAVNNWIKVVAGLTEANFFEPYKLEIGAANVSSVNN